MSLKGNVKEYLKQLAEKIFIEDKNFAREFKVHLTCI